MSKEKDIVLDALWVLDACPQSLRWIRKSKPATIQTIWNACKRPDWMLWFLLKMAKETNGNYNYYHRASAAALSACIDVILNNGICEEVELEQAIAASNALNQYGKNKIKSKISDIFDSDDYLTLLCSAGSFLLSGDMINAYDDIGCITTCYYECSTPVSNTWKLSKEMCDEIRRVTEPPALSELEEIGSDSLRW